MATITVKLNNGTKFLCLGWYCALGVAGKFRRLGYCVEFEV